MSKMFRFTIIVFTIFLSCSKKDTISFDNHFIVTGNIYKSTVSGKIPVSEATIGFNANFDTTDIQGNFLYENLKKGNYKIKIIKRNYPIFRDTIYIKKDTTINFN